LAPCSLAYLSIGIYQKQRKEWYEITEKGKIVLEILEQLAQLVEK